MTEPFARVAVARPVFRTFHYRIPEELRGQVRPGVRCVVPFGRTRLPGFVVAVEPTAEVQDPKDLVEVLDAEPCLSPDLLQLARWLAGYYCHPLGETLKAILPPACRAGSDLVYRLRAGGADPAEDRLRNLHRSIAEAGELPASRLSPSDEPLLEELVGRGAVCREWRVREVARPTPREWFRLAPEAPAPEALGGRAPRQAEVLRLLDQGGRVPAELLRAQGIARSVLRRLEANGWVVREAAEPDAVLPPGLQAEAAAVRLSVEQQQAVDWVSAALAEARFAPALLQGVTGSGKTEVYLRAAREARRGGLSVLVLVPEIALTPQMLGRFYAYFGEEVAVLHSGLGLQQRRLHWERVLSGVAPVVLGTRSAVFAPLPKLGLIIVDEEHEASYKQEEGLRYNGKHAALVRARARGATVLLGSATPDLETHSAAAAGRYARLVLPGRVAGGSLPDIRVVDLRQEDRRRSRRVLFSEPLMEGVRGALGRGEQALLFLNRRGFSPAFVCAGCGEAAGCPRCSIALTLHRAGSRPELVCHYCGRRAGVPRTCRACGSEGFAPAGVGTQQLAEAACEAWPGARVLRLDRDTARRTGGTDVLRSFLKGEADILVGTQMVAKGHHFPRLTVVGVVDADLSLHMPDFRAAERTFQLLTQVAGRAGREVLSGRVFIQTRNPHHPAIACAAAGDYEAFASAELEGRREAGFPPFRRLALVRLSDADADQGGRAAEVLAGELRQRAEPVGVEVLGPAPAPIERLRGRWRFQILLRGGDTRPGPLHAVLRTLRRSLPGFRGLRVHVDVDPVSLL